MPEKISTSKAKSVPAKSAAGARKPAMAKAAPVKRASARSVVAAKAVKKAPEKKDKKVKKVEAKVKVVRDSFTMPQNDYAKIGELKQVCQKAGVQVKKSELLRAGLHALGQLSTAQLKQTIAQMEQIKTGRPKKS